MSIFTTFRRKKSLECFGRRLEDEALRRASCVFMIYLLLSMFAGMIISEVEGIPLLAALFESISRNRYCGSVPGNHARTWNFIEDFARHADAVRTGWFHYDSAGVFLRSEYCRL